jgi:hypothetical protein
MQFFSRLSTRFTTNEKKAKAKVLVRSGVSPGYESVAVREIPIFRLGSSTSLILVKLAST